MYFSNHSPSLPATKQRSRPWAQYKQQPPSFHPLPFCTRPPFLQNIYFMYCSTYRAGIVSILLFLNISLRLSAEPARHSGMYLVRINIRGRAKIYLRDKNSFKFQRLSVVLFPNDLTDLKNLICQHDLFQWSLGLKLSNNNVYPLIISFILHFPFCYNQGLDLLLRPTDQKEFGGGGAFF